LDSPENRLVGSFELRSKAKAHYPCGAVGGGQSMQVAPHIGWANAVPDAGGEIDISMLGVS
jgi:hypothetical protein